MGPNWSLGLDVPAYTSARAPSQFYRSLVVEAEAAGFSNLWVGDHLLWHRPRFETFTLLGMLAGMTRLTVGSGVALAPLRAPWWLAKTAATLHTMAEGGCVLGLGAGGEYRREFELADVDPATRGARLDATIALCRQGWAGELGSDFSPASGQVPIWVAGRKGAALRRARDHADGWLGLFLTPDEFAQRRAELVAGRSVDRPPLVTAMAVWACVGEDDVAARREALRAITEEYRLPERAFDRYVLAGSVETVVAGLAAYVEAGVEHIDVHLAHEDPLPQVTLWGDHVVPRLRKVLSAGAAS